MLQITGLYASLLGLLIIFLAYKVVVFRRNQKVGLGDNGDIQGQKVIRCHANAVEYVPILIILMAIYELNGGSALVLNIIGVLAVVCRMLHALGLSKSGGVSTGRFYGTLITWLLIVTLAGLNIINYFTSLLLANI
jgi:uncharacterized membrane protein YecN with MAPEG domain